jgi:exopolysaccharide biosynthesis polyprenyl glycosylphosphotransferase
LYARGLMLSDAGLIAAAAVAGLIVRFGGGKIESVQGLPYWAIGGVIAVAWWLSLVLNRCFEPRFMGSGPEEYRRIFVASFRITALTAVAGYALHLQIARGFLAIVFPLGTALLLLSRYTARRLIWWGLGSRRRSERMVVVGDRAHVEELVRELRRESTGSIEVVGACLPGGGSPTPFLDGGEIPVVGTLTTVAEALRDLNADVVAVTASSAITPTALRRLGWALEDSPVDLLVVPALTNVAGPRVSVRPVAGLPLLHVDKPEFTGARKLAKEAVDRGLAFLISLVMAPVFAVVAVTIKVTSRGPAIFRQRRVGKNGQQFTLYKFRTMVVDAEQQLAGIHHLNEADGCLFKLVADPRVTRVGRFLRRFSLDELPQLINVLRGNMALVGPRPPLPDEVARYEGAVARRLLVKPGITGLWQVSGRSALGWEDYVRLDLQYVENWSLTLDLLILLKTLLAVVRRQGAY